MTEDEEALEKFLDGRTVGFGDPFGTFYWRGPGYDDGWQKMDLWEIAQLWTLMQKPMTDAR